MGRKKKLMLLIPALLIVMLLSACGAGADRYELTKYVGKSLATFERKSGIKPTKQSNGIYRTDEVVQVMIPEKKVTSVTLLKNAGEYTVFGVKIGMTKEEADLLLYDTFGDEVAKSANAEDGSVTYSYLKNEKELYISYDAEKETVLELSYYVSDGSEHEEIEETANSGELIAMIGNTKVYYNEALIYLKSIQESYETDYGKKIWNVDIMGNGKTFGSMIKDEVINQITELKIIRDKAGELGITLSEEEVAEANAYAKEHYEGLTAEDRTKYLTTEKLLQQVYSDNLLANKVFETLTINVDTNVPDAEAKQITVQDILIYSTDFDAKGNKVPLTEEEKEAAFEKVQSLLTQAKETEDFYSLAEANSEADSIEYTFGRGGGPVKYSNIFEQAAFNLKTGGISEIITTDYGWHIIYCVSDFNEDATIQVKENIIEERRNEMFAKLYDEWFQSYDIIINNEAWNSVAFEN